MPRELGGGGSPPGHRDSAAPPKRATRATEPQGGRCGRRIGGDTDCGCRAARADTSLAAASLSAPSGDPCGDEKAAPVLGTGSIERSLRLPELARFPSAATAGGEMIALSPAGTPCCPNAIRLAPQAEAFVRAAGVAATLSAGDALPLGVSVVKPAFAGAAPGEVRLRFASPTGEPASCDS